MNLTHRMFYEKLYVLGDTGLSDEMLQKYIRDHEAVWKDKVESLTTGSEGGTIGTHVGPGAIGVVFCSRRVVYKEYFVLEAHTQITRFYIYGCVVQMI